jgi:hypothetical protein
MPAETAPARVTPRLLDLPRPWLVGVLHLPALPGAPAARLDVRAVAEAATREARVLEEAGFGAVLVENYHDTPFRPVRADPETVAAMAVVTDAVARAVGMPVGVNVLRNDALSALAIAVAGTASFLRVNVLAGAAATDQGLLQGCADRLLRRRAALGADVAILADVDVKHATSLDTRPAEERARDLVARAGADAVLVTGPATGRPVDLANLERVSEAVAPTPVLAASGTDARTLPQVLARCAGVIAGTTLKDPATGRIDPGRAHAFAEAARS